MSPVLLIHVHEARSLLIALQSVKPPRNGYGNRHMSEQLLPIKQILIQAANSTQATISSY